MSPKTILGIDTATLTASVALIRATGSDGGDVGEMQLLASGQSSVNTHSQRLLGLIDEALRSAGLTLGQLDGIAIGAGPGSFTGLRIGMATAKGLAFAGDVPLWAVSSLASLALSAADVSAQAVADDTLVVPILDARRMEVFAGFYRVASTGVESVGAELVTAPEDLGLFLDQMLATAGCARALALGDGIAAYQEALDQLAEGRPLRFIDGPTTPPAAAVARLALRGDHRDIVIDGSPSYIRLSEAEIKYPNGNPGGAFKARITVNRDNEAE